MPGFVLDSYAMLSFFRNEAGAEQIAQLLNDAAGGKHQLYISNVNAGEVYYIAYRKEGLIKAELAWKGLLQFPIVIIESDLEATLAAAKLKAKYSISYANAFAAALTINKKATLITGDQEFMALRKETGFKVKYL